MKVVVNNLIQKVMPSKEYKVLLNRPEWKAKRLEILKRDEHACQQCGYISVSNHVHHLSYIANNPPWDYPNSYLTTLCSRCHRHVHNIEEVPVEAVDKFFKISFKHLAYVLGNTSGNEYIVLTALMLYCDYNTNRIKLTPLSRKDLATVTALKKSTINKVLGSLKAKGFISGSNGDYTMKEGLFIFGNK